MFAVLYNQSTLLTMLKGTPIQVADVTPSGKLAEKQVALNYISHYRSKLYGILSLCHYCTCITFSLCEILLRICYKLSAFFFSFLFAINYYFSVLDLRY